MADPSLLEVLIVGGLMGLLGQGARAVVGLKGMADNAKARDLTPNDLFEAARLIVSLLIGFLVGLAAALIYIKTAGSPLTEPTWQVLIGFAASGYVGVDFLEGFISQYLPQGTSGAAAQKIAALKAANLALQKAPPSPATLLVYSVLQEPLTLPDTTPLSTLLLDGEALIGTANRIKARGVNVDTGLVQRCTTIADLVHVVAATMSSAPKP
jgi:putative chitinase